MTNVLFICSRNQWRSPTAEYIFKRHPEVNARSAGTSPRARHTVTTNDINWAEVIFVMEEKHKSRLNARFRQALTYCDVHVLDIPDEYQFMDDDLIEMLSHSVNSYLGIS